MHYKKYQKPETESWYTQGNMRKIRWREYLCLLYLFYWGLLGVFFVFRENKEKLTEEVIFKKPTTKYCLDKQPPHGLDFGLP